MGGIHKAGAEELVVLCQFSIDLPLITPPILSLFGWLITYSSTTNFSYLPQPL